MLACYTEVMNLGYKVTGAKHLKPLAWALFVVQQYSFVGDKVLRYTGINEEVLLNFILQNKHAVWVEMKSSFQINPQYHMLITFALYIGCLIWFVLSLDKDYIKRLEKWYALPSVVIITFTVHCSYAILAWSHMALFYFGFPGHLLNLTVMEGMIWYVLPMTLITLNDITAYYVGFFFGRTPLIKVQHLTT